MTEWWRRTPFARADDALVLAIGAVTAIVLVALDVSPTGATGTDLVALVVVACLACWCAAAAPWWSIAALGILAAVIGDSWQAVVLGALVAIDAVVLGLTGRATAVARAALFGGALIALSFARDLGGWGINALVCIAAAGAVAVTGLVLRDRRRPALVVIGVVAIAMVVAGLVGVLTARSVRDDLADGNRVARAGLRELEAGEFDAARESFAAAADSFDSAADALGSPLVQPTRLIPIASQHVTAGAELSRAATSAALTVEDELNTVDVDALRIDDGRIDVDAVLELSGSMHRLQAAIDDLDTSVASARNGWLLDPVTELLDDLDEDLATQRDRGDRVVQALDVAPAMLGQDEERVYLVMFTTPAEARGQGGFMGNWAELSIDDGRITMTDYGNDEVLNDGGPRPRRLEDAPPDWLERYGQFGFVDDEGLVGNVPWKNITMSPNYPSTARVAAELYPKSGGREVDGVFSLDVYALETLIGLVGPIEVDGAPRPLTGENAAEFLLFEQYLTDDHEARGDMLEAVTVAAVDRLLHTSPPDPLDLGKGMAPLVDERRLMAWSAHEAEQRLFSDLGLDGSVRADADQMVSVAVVNAGGSKIDAFLEHEVTVVDGPDGPSVEVELHNHAPASGLPDFVIGNAIGLPRGTSRLWVSGFSSAPITSITSDSGPLDDGTGSEAGLSVRSAFVELGPGEATTLVFDLDAPDLTADAFVVVPQPLVREPATTFAR